MKFGKILESLMIRSNISIKDLSDRSDVPQQRIAQLLLHSTPLAPEMFEVEDLVMCFVNHVTKKEIHDIIKEAEQYIPDANYLTRDEELLFYVLNGYSNKFLIKHFGIVNIRRNYENCDS